MTDNIVKETFTVTRHLSKSNSFGTVAQGKDIELTVNMHYNRNEERGSFEFSDDDGEWYAEGMLIFTDGVLTDYDGVYAVPDFVLDWLQVQGVDVRHMREAMNR